VPILPYGSSRCGKEYRSGQNDDNKAVWIVSFCSFWILLFPKAGVKTGELPFLVSSFCALLLVAFLVIRKKKSEEHARVSGYVFFATWWYFLIIFRNSDFQFSSANKFAALSWFLLSPIFWILANKFRLSARTLNINWIYLCFSILSIYAISQYFFGLEFFQIPGLTIASGDSYLVKNLSIFEYKNVVAVKSPSTYQGGNLFGQTATIVLVWVLEVNSKKNYGSKALRLFMILSISAALLLSLSRTALVALAFGWLVYFSRSRSNGKGFLGIVVLFIVFAAYLEPVIFNRFSLTNLTSDAGRTDIWRQAFETYTPLDWLLGRVGPIPRRNVIMEGVFGLLSQVGLIGLIYLILCWKRAGLTKWPGVTAVFCFCVAIDSTYYYPPFMWIPALLLIYGNNIADSAKAKESPSKPNAFRKT